MRLGKTAYACACALIALAVLGTAAATASVKPTKKKTVAAKTTKIAGKKPKPAVTTKPGATKTTQSEPLCRFGQDDRNKPACTPNPLFGKDVCDSYIPQVQALGPGMTIATAGNRYGPVVNTVSCYFTANGHTQSLYFTTNGGPDFHTNSLVDTSKQIDLQQAFEEEYQEWTQGTNNCDPEPAGAVKTTIEGFEAFTVDLCPSMSNGVTRPAGGRVEVLAGDLWVMVGASWTFDVTSSSQLIPFAEQLIAKYH